MKDQQTLISPLEKYKQDLTQTDFVFDPQQQVTVEQLEYLYHRLIQQQHHKSKWSWMPRFWDTQKTPEKGLYIWGGVGRGKTYLMDTFYDLLPFQEKKRVHFHRMMHWVHQELKRYAGRKNPIKHVARTIAKNTCIICFDEFFVSDITDAMILAGLLASLFEQGITLVATSNIPPEKLYWNGLQRERFEPAIALIQQNTQIIHLDSITDYRLRTLEQAEIYHFPLDEQAQKNLTFSFEHLVLEEQTPGSKIEIEGRWIHTVRVGEGVVWLSFREICCTPRSQNDYIELSRCFHTVLIDSVEQMSDNLNDAARRWINLVDEFYERKVNLIITAEVEIDALYIGQSLAFEFKRTISRLKEMQSCEYLSQPHLP